jgi:hypothetical protein
LKELNASKEITLQQISDIDEFYINESEKCINFMMRRLSMDNVFDMVNTKNYNHLLSISNKKGEEYTLATLEIFLAYFAQIHNEKNTTNDPFLISNIAQAIFYDFRHRISFAEIILFLKNGVYGYYRHKDQFTKEPFDLPNVIRWLNLFLDDKAKKFEIYNDKYHKQQKEHNRLNPDGTFYYGVDYKFLKEQANKERERKTREKDERVRTLNPQQIKNI